jgi:ABC-type polysaccharide/polyol phosphate transport system ATPase subunit
MSCDDIAISARNLTKAYRIYSHPLHRVMHKLGVPGLRGYRQIEALTDVSFDIRKGEAVGIIGRNGSGKSTLLQIISGILKPTSGSIAVNGRISALLELGAGFNPEFTGRENVYFHGALTGLTKQAMNARFDDIVAFADIGEFIDQPVRTYSSGMFVRLAFAVAVHVDPDILVVDEALAVGDARFQARSVDRMRQLMQRGIAVLMVSHDIPSLKALCDRVVELDHGRVARLGASGEVCDAYIVEQLVAFAPIAPAPIAREVGEGADLTIVSAELLDERGRRSTTAQFGDFVTLRITLAVHRNVERATLAFYIKDRHRIEVLGTNTDYEGLALPELLAQTSYEVAFRYRNGLRGGHYSVTVLAACPDIPGKDYLDWREDLLSFESMDIPGQPRWAMAAPFATVSVRGPFTTATAEQTE